MQFKNIIASIAALSVASVLASPIAAEKAVAPPEAEHDVTTGYNSFSYYQHKELYEQSTKWAHSYYEKETTVINYVEFYKKVTDAYGQDCLKDYWGNWNPRTYNNQYPFSIVWILGVLYQDLQLIDESRAACKKLVLYYQQHGFTTGSGFDETDGGSDETGGTYETGGTGTGSTDETPSPKVFDSFNNAILQNNGNVNTGDGVIQGNNNNGNNFVKGNNNQVTSYNGGILNGLLGNGLLNNACILSKC